MKYVNCVGASGELYLSSLSYFTTFLLFYFFTFIRFFLCFFLYLFLSLYIHFSSSFRQSSSFIFSPLRHNLHFFLLFLLLGIWFQKLSLSHSPYHFIFYFLSSIGDYLLEFEKTVGMAGRTEVYRCERCSQLTRFSRFEVKLNIPYISL